MQWHANSCARAREHIQARARHTDTHGAAATAASKLLSAVEGHQLRVSESVYARVFASVTVIECL